MPTPPAIGYTGDPLSLGLEDGSMVLLNSVLVLAVGPIALLTHVIGCKLGLVEPKMAKRGPTHRGYNQAPPLGAVVA